MAITVLPVTRFATQIYYADLGADQFVPQVFSRFSEIIPRHTGAKFPLGNTKRGSFI